MNTETNKYPAYKDSGIEWLGEIPSHWEVSKLKFFHDVQLGKMLQNDPKTEEDVLLPYLRAANLQWGGVDLSDIKEMWFTKKEIDKYILQPGDLLVSEGGDIGRSSIWNGEIDLIGIQNAINRVRPKQNSSSKFLYYWIYSLKSLGWVDTLCNKATIAHFTAEKVERLEIVVPPLPEQKAIATFLDHQTSRIDQLIEKKKRILELLDEQRQAIITRAVTKGIDPDIPMKVSGIEWLGDMPVHWELNRLKFYTQINPVKSEVSFLPDDFEVTFTPMEAVKEFGGLDTSIEKTKGDVYQGYTYFKEGDVLSAKITPCFENGKAAIAENLKNGIGFGTTELHVLRPNEKLNRKFLFYMVISETFLKVGESEMLGAGGQKRVRQEFIEDWMWGFPPINEQERIVQFIDEQSSKIDQLNSKIVAAIDHLEEYRSSLITQAVTGKIDVREQVKEKELNYAAEDRVSYQTN